MSLVDYGQTADDHQSMLILVRHTGSHLPTSLFNRVWERIRALNTVHIQGQNRNVTVRYKRGYPPENNDWGEFQAHRKVLGLICIGKCVDHEEFADLFENYKKVKEEYASTIINSRFIIFGMNTDGSPIDPRQQQHIETSSQSHLQTDHLEGTNSEIPNHSETFQSLLDHNSLNCLQTKSSAQNCVTGSGMDLPDSIDNIKSTFLSPESSTTSISTENLVNANSCSAESSLNINSRAESLAKSNSCSAEGNSNSYAESSTSVMDSEDSTLSLSVRKSVQSQPSREDSELRRTHSNSLTKESTGSEVVFYPNLEQCSDLEERLKEFITSLFFVLEGKRLERSFERSDRLMLLCAPFEKKDYIGVDTDTKSFKKKCMGRLRKHLGDLCLQACLPGEAILHYQTALDLLRSVNDFLWMGGCYEGLCSSSVVLTYPKSTLSSLRRIQSFSVKRGSSSPDLPTKTGPANIMRSQMSTGSFANGFDGQDGSFVHCLNPEDIIEKYNEAIMNYSKYKHAAMIEMEASLKACRVLIRQQKFLQASDFLQNVVYINLQSSEEDKIQRYTTLSFLYGQIGFERKEAFFKRVAAMQCVSPGVTPAWHQCYQLLLQAVSGYRIALDPREAAKGPHDGWPVIQHRVLNELVYSARRMGNPQLAVRHMTLLLHILFPHLLAVEQQEAVVGLESLTARCPGTSQPLSTENGLILPPVPLIKFPTVRLLKPIAPPSHLCPVRIESGDISPTFSSVFIYTPLSLGNKADKKSDSPAVDFLWVAGDMCEVQLYLVNPLVVELRLFYLGLLTEGVDVEMFPASPPTILPDSPPMSVRLVIKPQLPGKLRITGYSTVVFGVRSHCRLRDLGCITPPPPPYYEIEVIPALPQIALTCSLPKASTFASSAAPDGATVVANVSALLYAGQSQECQVTLQNISTLTISSLNVKLDTRGDYKECNHVEKMLQWSDDNIQSQLPLLPAAHLCISLCLYGYSDFLLPLVMTSDMSSSSASSPSRLEHLETRGSQTLEAMLSVQYTGKPGQEAGYCRRCCLALAVDVLPSVYITNWDAVPASSDHEVTLVLDLLNASSHQVDVRCQNPSNHIVQTVIIEAEQSRRVTITLQKVVFPEEIESHESCIPVKYRSWHAQDHYSQYLSRFIDIQWSMPAIQVCGKVSIDHVKWSRPQLDVITLPALSWEVSMNNQRYIATDVMTFFIGQPITLRVTLHTSHLADTYSDLCLTMQPIQEVGEGRGVLSSDVYFCLGSQTFAMSQLLPYSSVCHTCTLVFLSPGHFGLHLVCQNPDSSLEQLSCTCLPVPHFTVQDYNS